MNFETAQRSVDFLLANCCKSCGITFFGGEPLTQFGLIRRTVEYAEAQAGVRDIQIGFHVTTNGILITPDVAKYLKAHKFTVIVSLDGDERAHDSHRVFADGSGTYSLSMKGAKTLIQEYGSQDGITIRGTFTHHQKRLTESFQHLAANGFENISIEPATGGDESEFSVKTDDVADVFAEYDNLASVYKDYVTGEGSFANKANFFHFQKQIQNIVRYRMGQKPCGAAVGYMAVSPDGGLYPCHRIVTKQFQLGDVYNGVTRTEIGQRFDSAIVEVRPECSICWARRICGGGCYANSLAINHDIVERNEIECLLTRKRIEVAIGLIVENANKLNLAQQSGIQLRYLNCTSWCEDSCQTACESSCQSRCDGSCQAACECSCQYRCESSCQTSFENRCQSGCESSCQARCQDSCQTYCENSCQTTCQTSFQNSCETSCQSSCESSCTSFCESSNQNQCGYSCQSACQDSCQAACDSSQTGSGRGSGCYIATAAIKGHMNIDALNPLKLWRYSVLERSHIGYKLSSYYRKTAPFVAAEIDVRPFLAIFLRKLFILPALRVLKQRESASRREIYDTILWLIFVTGLSIMEALKIVLRRRKC